MFNQLKELVHAEPFQPFRLHLSDGKELTVPHRDYILVASPNVVVANIGPEGEPGATNFVPLMQIARVEMLPHNFRRVRKG